MNEPGSMVGWLIKALFKHRSTSQHTDRGKEDLARASKLGEMEETWEAGVHSEARQANRKTGR